MDRISTILLLMILIPGCRLTGQMPVRTAQTAVIACEAAHISIQHMPSEREEQNENDIP